MLQNALRAKAARSMGASAKIVEWEDMVTHARAVPVVS